MGCKKDTQELVDKLEKEQQRLGVRFEKDRIEREPLKDVKRDAEAAKRSNIEAQRVIGPGIGGEGAIAVKAEQLRVKEAVKKLQGAIPDPKVKMSEKQIKEGLELLDDIIVKEDPVVSGERVAGQTLRTAEGQARLKQEAKISGRERIKREPAKAEEVLRKIAQMDSKKPEDIQAFVDMLKVPTKADYIYEYWYNGILSGFSTTHVVNVISTGLFTGWQIPHTFVRAAAEIPLAALQGRTRQHTFGEALALWNGYKAGWRQGIEKSFEIIRTGALQDDMSKWGVEMGKSLEAWQRSPYKALRAASPLVSLPSRLLRAEDTFFKAIAYSGEMNLMAYKEAIAIATKEGLSGAKFSRRVGEIVAKLMKKPSEEMMEKAGKFARYATFNDAPGPIVQGVISLRDSTPFARIVLPFIRTIANLTQRGIDLVPLGGIAQRRAFGAAEARGTQADIVASQAMGMALTLGIYTLFKYSDGEITGALPPNKAERDAFYQQGKMPWSLGLTINGEKRYFSYRRVEPWNTLFSTIANFGDAFRDKGEVPTSEKVTEFGLRFSKNILDGSYLSQFSQLLQAINMAEQGNISAEKFAQRMATSFIPYSTLTRTVANALDTQQEGERLLRRPQDIKQAFEASIPTQVGKVEPEIGIFGTPIVIPGGAIRQATPFKFSKESDDLVVRELARLNEPIGLPGRTLDGEKLSDGEYRRLKILSGKRLRLMLFRRMKSPGWKGMTEDRQRRAIRKIKNDAREFGRKQYRRERLRG